MMVVMLILLITLSLYRVEQRSSNQDFHRSQAEANARLAVVMAIAELQKYAGADQVVTANASILESPENGESLPHRNWLGVWATNHEHDGESWPLIGKVERNSSVNSPYTRKGALQDLRSLLPSMRDGAWRDKQNLTWLVSRRSEQCHPRDELDDSEPHVLEIVGRGSLGNLMSEADFIRNRVLVEKVDVTESGALAWYIFDHSQKARIVPQKGSGNELTIFSATSYANPTYVGDGKYEGLTDKMKDDSGKLVTMGTVKMTQGDKAREALKANYHDFTAHSHGLFTDTLMGGMRYDLTPLLSAKFGQDEVDFSYVPSMGKSKAFSSAYPIIAGPDHGVLGASFAALRDWAQHQHQPLTKAEVTFPKNAVRNRPNTNWPHGLSDGACADVAMWSNAAPKIHPVMTEARWHYYFSHQNNSIRTHIVPRVCLWNPYSRDLEIPDLSVMLPNPFYNLSDGMHFIMDNAYIDTLKLDYDKDHVFGRWNKNGGYAGGDTYKFKLNPFPETRFLAFTLQGTSLAAGECHVFSPKIANPDITQEGVSLQAYDPDNVSLNILSSAAQPSRHHFFYDHGVDIVYKTQSPQRIINGVDLSALDFSKVIDYQPQISMNGLTGEVENFPFILKSGTANQLSDLYNQATLQLINHGAGGVVPTKVISIQGQYWGSANQQDASFGALETFAENPSKDAAATHQVGAKLLWLNESETEGNNAPYRAGTTTGTRWESDHMVYNVCQIANWNIRAQLTTRSPVSQCGTAYYLHSTGPWLVQFSPLAPQDQNDLPQMNDAATAYVKNPFGAAITFAKNPDVILFDLPSDDYGVISLANLRHAMLSPYSWSPSYIIGHSLRDLHAPADSTAHEVAAEETMSTALPTRWDYLLGAAEGATSHGTYALAADSQGLMQIGSQAVTRTAGNYTWSSKDEVLAYDIAYEVNYHLWDRFFLSSMPLSEDSLVFDWNPAQKKYLWNRAYQFNGDVGESLHSVVNEMSSTEGVNPAFWRNAERLKNSAAFNVNSTSVAAWTAFLSSTLGFSRPLESGVSSDQKLSFARYDQPEMIGDTVNADPDSWAAWQGARGLTAAEVQLLAEKIVKEIKKRGPFISISDFINRRLVAEGDDTSLMGAMDAAIDASGLNAGFEGNEEYVSTEKNRGTKSESLDNNLSDFSESYRYQDNNGFTTAQPTSQAWGLPGYLMQGDILEPLAPSLAVRGDSFTIRCYGESCVNGKVLATAWIEVVVERTPLYVNQKENSPSDSLKVLDYQTGEYLDGGLSEINQKFGRKFVIKSTRWLSAKEI